MRLLDLDPHWLIKDGKRIGFCFRSPKRPKWWLTCFAVATSPSDQREALVAAIGDGLNWLQCKEIAWTVTGGIEAAHFETMTVKPSIDAGELWHGFITNGEIVGGTS